MCNPRCNDLILGGALGCARWAAATHAWCCSVRCGGTVRCRLSATSRCIHHRSSTRADATGAVDDVQDAEGGAAPAQWHHLAGQTVVKSGSIREQIP